MVALSGLPEEVLVHCLKFISQNDRLKRVALVNKRFRELCLHPELLLHTLDVCIVGSTQSALRRTQALAELLAVHARHVRCLSLHIESLDTQGKRARPERLAALATLCLNLCAAGRLERLDVSSETRLASAAWLPALTSLQQLRLDCSSLEASPPVWLPNGFSRLTALPNACLPSSLTWLQLRGCSTDQMPRQLSKLTCLHALEVDHCPYSPGSMALLASLGSLRRLKLTQNRAPTGLPALSQLESLEVSVTGSCFSDLEDILEAARSSFVLELPHLTRLTSLALRGQLSASWRPSIASLGRLQRLRIWHITSQCMLPAGPCLSSLRWLALPWEDLQESAGSGALAGATRLEHLLSLGMPALSRLSRTRTNWLSKARPRSPLEMLGAAHGWAAFWHFAACHPPLCTLSLCSIPDATPSSELSAALRALRCSRPSLVVAMADLAHVLSEDW